MQFSKFSILSAALALAVLSGCANHLVEVRPGSDSIAVKEANEVGGCESKGAINVGVVSEVGFYTRNADAVEGNLLQLARNGAVDAGGNTVVRGNSSEYGKRSFSIYKCQR